MPYEPKQKLIIYRRIVTVGRRPNEWGTQWVKVGDRDETVNHTIKNAANWHKSSHDWVGKMIPWE